jgi:ATP phosphoribosyltransferase regulatory subunit
VELLGADCRQALVADAELLRLLLACLRQLQVSAEHKPTLLLGHHGLLTALLDQVPTEQRLATRQALINFDPLALGELELPAHQRQGLQQLMRLRGDAKAVLYQLEQLLGPAPLLDQLAGTLNSVAAVAAEQGVRLQLDPSFQPHFDLYDGLVLKLVCQGTVAPVAIASGGRYDALVARFGGAAGGMGFSFDIEAIRDLLGTETTAPQRPEVTLVAYSTAEQLTSALDQLESLHRTGVRAELLQTPCPSQAEAEAIASQRSCAACHWIGS